jgi:hypothetical protein
LRSPRARSRLTSFSLATISFSVIGGLISLMSASAEILPRLALDAHRRRRQVGHKRSFQQRLREQADYPSLSRCSCRS